MPLYAYQCEKCGHKFEELLSVSAGGTAVCPKCGANGKRVWNGKCFLGGKSASGGCSGSCAGCAGCSHGGH